MTREEILNMPAGREMDALMWLVLHDKPLILENCRYVDGDVQPHAGQPIGHVSPPNYSTDIAAAWEVVEKMITNGWWNTDIGFGGGIVVSFDDGSKTVEARADTAPLAICRVALLATIGE